MTNLKVLFGMGASMAMMVWACGSDVTNLPGDTTSTGATGGAGGTATVTATASSSSSSSSASSSSSTGGMGNNPCEKACNKIEVECGFGSVCSMIPFLNCSEMSSYCYGNCILDANCAAIASLVGTSPDPTLASCISSCMGGGSSCQQCVLTNCSTEVQACQGNATCQGFLGCATSCGDQNCIDDCASKNDSAETQKLVACGVSNCSSECANGQGGAGGAGVGGAAVGGAGGSSQGGSGGT